MKFLKEKVFNGVLNIAEKIRQEVKKAGVKNRKYFQN
jgi:hypothetical protein